VLENVHELVEQEVGLAIGVVGTFPVLGSRPMRPEM
jgi:hypothetical protein